MMRLLNRFKNKVMPSNQSSSASTPAVSPETAYSLLSNERRRLIIDYLADMDASTTDAREIADYLSSTGDDRTAAYISCIQQHLPRMSQVGLIEYDEQAKTVRPLASLDAVYEAHKAVERTLD